MAKRTEIMVARISASVLLDGKNHVIHRDRTTAHANHPIVQGREQMWRRLVVDYAVEEAEAEEVAEVKEEAKAKPARKRAAAKAENKQ